MAGHPRTREPLLGSDVQTADPETQFRQDPQEWRTDVALRDGPVGDAGTTPIRMPSSHHSMSSHWLPLGQDRAASSSSFYNVELAIERLQGEQVSSVQRSYPSWEATRTELRIPPVRAMCRAGLSGAVLCPDE